MSNITMPDELYRKAAEIAEAQPLTADEVVASVFAERVAAWERLERRASQGDRDKFFAVLDKVPDVEPEDFDRP